MSPYTKGMRPADNPEGNSSMIAESRKAIAAFLLAFLGPIGVVLAATDQPLDWRVAASAFVAGLIAGLTTYAVRNEPKPADPPFDAGV